MKKLESLKAVALALGDGGPFGPDTYFETVEQVVDALVELGNADQVYVYHDEHLGLKDNLSEKFLASRLSNIVYDDFEQDIETVLGQANKIIPLSERELSEDDLEDIRYDKISRGEVVDD